MRLERRARKATLIRRVLEIRVVEPGRGASDVDLSEAFGGTVSSLDGQLDRPAIGRKGPEKSRDHRSSPKRTLESHAETPAVGRIRFGQDMEGSTPGSLDALERA